MIFCDLELESSRFTCPSFTIPMGSSFVFNLHSLELFIRFCFWYYQHPENLFRKKNEALYREGHIRSISDMNMIDRFAKTIKAPYISEVRDGVLIDPNLGIPQGFILENGYKKIKFLWGKPYGMLENGTVVRFLTLHCWGKMKVRMSWFLSESEKSL
jgi:hypothetical protein